MTRARAFLVFKNYPHRSPALLWASASPPPSGLPRTAGKMDLEVTSPGRVGTVGRTVNGRQQGHRVDQQFGSWVWSRTPPIRNPDVRACAERPRRLERQPRGRLWRPLVARPAPAVPALALIGRNPRSTLEGPRTRTKAPMVRAAAALECLALAGSAQPGLGPAARRIARPARVALLGPSRAVSCLIAHIRTCPSDFSGSSEVAPLQLWVSLVIWQARRLKRVHLPGVGVGSGEIEPARPRARASRFPSSLRRSRSSGQSSVRFRRPMASRMMITWSAVGRSISRRHPSSSPSCKSSQNERRAFVAVQCRTERQRTYRSRRMLEDMAVRRMGEKTKSDYIKHVETFTRFLGRSPDRAHPNHAATVTPAPQAGARAPLFHDPELTFYYAPSWRELRVIRVESTDNTGWP